MNNQTTSSYARFAGLWLHNGKGSLVVFSTSNRSNGVVKFAKQDGTSGYLSAEEAHDMVEELTLQGFTLMNAYGKKLKATGKIVVDTTEGVVIKFTGTVRYFEGHIGWKITHEVGGSCLETSYKEFYSQWNSATLGNIDVCDPEGNRFTREAFGIKEKPATRTASTNGFSFSPRS
jgi:hypothetical protein